MIEEILLKALGAGGDLATVALLVVMWRFDRRLLKLEMTVCNRKGKTDG